MLGPTKFSSLLGKTLEEKKAADKNTPRRCEAGECHGKTLGLGRLGILLHGVGYTDKNTINLNLTSEPDL